MEDDKQLTDEELAEMITDFLENVKIRKTLIGRYYTWKIRWWHKHNKDKYQQYVDSMTEIISNELHALAEKHGSFYIDELPEDLETGKKMSAADISETICTSIVNKEIGVDEADFWLDLIIYKGEQHQ